MTELSLIELITQERIVEVDRWVARRAVVRALTRPPRPGRVGALRVRLGTALVALGRRLAGPEAALDET